MILNPAASPHSVTIVGGGVAGIAAACALADAGLQVTLLERRGYLGGRASSYLHPGVNEVIDNCQHVLFGCCTNLVGLYERLGVADQIFWDNRMTLIEPGGRRSALKPSALPAPIHGLPAILRAKCFSSADKASLGYAISSILTGPDPNPRQNLEDWLRKHFQTKGAVERFWRLVLASALNAELDQIAVPYAFKVIRELFLNSAAAGAMGMSRIPLSQLYGSAEPYITQRGGRVLFHANVEQAEYSESARLWTVRTATETYTSGSLILALPFEATAKLLPNLPANPAAQVFAQSLSQLTHWPICSVHLWFDREITDLDHAALLDRETHWMYHKSHWQPQRDRSSSYIELVISTSREFAALPREAALARAQSQFFEFFPEARSARVVKSALIKEVRATFGVPPGVDAIRPSATGPWPSSYLAGDWIATGWPSTMESAARSGYLAAEALCRTLGDSRSFLVPDLKPEGLMRFIP
jgi:squalene-associated FAD-dependent desaturase